MEDIDITKQEYIEAIKEGVARGIFRIASNATDMPCADFYDSIKKGVENAIGYLDVEELFNKRN